MQDQISWRCSSLISPMQFCLLLVKRLRCSFSTFTSVWCVHHAQQLHSVTRARTTEALKHSSLATFWICTWVYRRSLRITTTAGFSQDKNPRSSSMAGLMPLLGCRPGAADSVKGHFELRSCWNVLLVENAVGSHGDPMWFWG